MIYYSTLMLYSKVNFNSVFNACDFFDSEDLHVHAGIAFHDIFEIDVVGAKYI